MMRRVLAIAILCGGTFAVVSGCGRPSETGVVPTSQEEIDQYATPPGVAEDAAKAAAEAAAAAR